MPKCLVEEFKTEIVFLVQDSGIKELENKLQKFLMDEGVIYPESPTGYLNKKIYLDPELSDGDKLVCLFHELIHYERLGSTPIEESNIFYEEYIAHTEHTYFYTNYIKNRYECPWMKDYLIRVKKIGLKNYIRIRYGTFKQLLLYHLKNKLKSFENKTDDYSKGYSECLSSVIKWSDNYE